MVSYMRSCWYNWIENEHKNNDDVNLGVRFCVVLVCISEFPAAHEWQKTPNGRMRFMCVSFYEADADSNLQINYVSISIHNGCRCIMH